MLQIMGAILVALPFAVVLAISVKFNGWRVTAQIVAAVFAVFLTVWIGVLLLGLE